MREVVDGVADLVVVNIISNARLAAEPLNLLLGLELLGAREEAARGDAVLDEAGVVGAAAELGGDELGVDAAEVVLEVGLDDVGAGRAGDVESVAVTVIDAKLVVGAGDLQERVLTFQVHDAANGNGSSSTMSKLR